MANKKNYKKSSKSATESKSKKQSQRVNVFKVAAQFWRDAIIELKKVKWPTKKELMASTIMVLVLVLIVAFYLGLVDIGLINIINRIVG